MTNPKDQARLEKWQVVETKERKPKPETEAKVLTGSSIDRYRRRVLLSALGLELKGMKKRGWSAYSIIKSEFGLKGSRQSVYDQFKAQSFPGEV